MIKRKYKVKSKYIAIISLVIAFFLILFSMRMSYEKNSMTELATTNSQEEVKLVFNNIWALELTGDVIKPTDSNDDIAYTLEGAELHRNKILTIGAISLLFSATFGGIYIRNRKWS